MGVYCCLDILDSSLLHFKIADDLRKSDFGQKASLLEVDSSLGLAPPRNDLSKRSPLSGRSDSEILVDVSEVLLCSFVEAAEVRDVQLEVEVVAPVRLHYLEQKSCHLRLLLQDLLLILHVICAVHLHVVLCLPIRDILSSLLFTLFFSLSLLLFRVCQRFYFPSELCKHSMTFSELV